MNLTTRLDVKSQTVERRAQAYLENVSIFPVSPKFKSDVPSNNHSAFYLNRGPIMAQFYMKFHNSTCKNTQYKSLKQWLLIGAADNFRIPHSPQMERQRSCGAFLMSGRCKLACIRSGSEKAQRAQGPGCRSGLSLPPPGMSERSDEIPEEEGLWSCLSRGMSEGFSPTKSRERKRFGSFVIKSKIITFARYGLGQG
jgi:hypothetical protein